MTNLCLWRIVEKPPQIFLFRLQKVIRHCSVKFDIVKKKWRKLQRMQQWIWVLEKRANSDEDAPNRTRSDRLRRYGRNDTWAPAWRRASISRTQYLAGMHSRSSSSSSSESAGSEIWACYQMLQTCGLLHRNSRWDFPASSGSRRWSSEGIFLWNKRLFQLINMLFFSQLITYACILI